MRSEEEFKELGYSFISGLLAKDDKDKKENKDSEDNKTEGGEE